MLAACRLAGLSALILDYEGGGARAQRSATAAAETATGRPFRRWRHVSGRRLALPAREPAPDAPERAGRQKRLQRRL
jgi:hypothetical protein